MKLLKKAASLVLSGCIICSLASISAFADGLALTENFDGYAVTDGYFINYPNASQSQTSDIYESDGRGQAGYKIVSEAGADGTNSNMLELRNTTGDYVYLKTKSMTWWAPGAVTNYSFDINFKSVPENTDVTSNGRLLDIMENFNIREGAPTTLYAKDNVSSATAEITHNKWYKFKMTVEPNGNRTDTLTDAETGEVILSQLMTTYSSARTASLAAVRMFYVTGESPRISILIDNVSLSSYDPTTTPAQVIKSSVTNGETGYARNKAMEFTFSQPVLGAVVLKKGDETIATGEPVSAPSEKITLSFAGLLERNTPYTLSFGGVLNSESLPCTDSDITFTTEDLHLYDDVTISNLSADEAKTAVTFTISDIYDYPVFSGNAIASVYSNGQMVGLDMVTLTEQDATAPITKSFSLGGQPQTGDMVKITLVDTLGGFTPLSVGSYVK